MNNRFIQLFAFFVSGTAFGIGLVRIPIALDRRTLLCLFIGVASSALLTKDLAVRFFVFWTTLAGAAGLIHLLGNHLEPILGNSNHKQYFDSIILRASAIYMLFLITGLLMLHRMRKKRNPHLIVTKIGDE
jgi:hypothetical protein